LEISEESIPSLSKKKKVKIMSSVKLQATSSTCKNQMDFYKLARRNPKKKNFLNSIYSSITQNKMLRSKLNQGGELFVHVKSMKC
jgi:hypothetical protein